MLEQDIVRRALVNSAAEQRAAGELLNRVFDVVIASAAIIMLAPLIVLAAVAVMLERRGPILFTHQRIGQGGRTFAVFKLRTMAVDGDGILEKHLQDNPAARLEWETDHKLRDDPRVSRLGRLLRASSVDELPQFFNVLRGEMSIVGPRPITLAEVVRYGDHFKMYCAVKPGITGVWQVSGRNNISYQRRVEMDALYARRKNVLLDAKIVLMTVPAVLLRRGSY